MIVAPQIPAAQNSFYQVYPAHNRSILLGYLLRYRVMDDRGTILLQLERNLIDSSPIICRKFRIHQNYMGVMSADLRGWLTSIRLRFFFEVRWNFGSSAEIDSTGDEVDIIFFSRRFFGVDIRCHDRQLFSFYSLLLRLYLEQRYLEFCFIYSKELRFPGYSNQNLITEFSSQCSQMLGCFSHQRYRVLTCEPTLRTKFQGYKTTTSVLYFDRLIGRQIWLFSF